MKRSLCTLLLLAGVAPLGSQTAAPTQEAAVPRALEVPTTQEAVQDFAPVPGESPDELGGKSAVGLKAYLTTQPDARALTMTVPAPRGQIVDRNGETFAQNVVRHNLAIRMPYLQEPTDEEVLANFLPRLVAANKAMGTDFSVQPEEVIRHYRNRRWIPMIIGGLLPEEQARKLKPLEGQGIIAHPSYMRTYPQGSSAAHIIGYVGKARPLPVTAVEDGEPIFVETEGRSGLEKSFENDLKGTPGQISMIFAADGSKLTEETISVPTPGSTVVTSLDLRFQRIAENALKNNCRSGALVIMDCRTGDIRAMASWPTFDPNLYVPFITDAEHKKLNEDPKKPLFPRAFQGTYPPASTFKLIVSLAALQSGKVTANTMIDCPGSIKLGGKSFRNWHSGGEGSMGVINAIKRSCNTWYYQVGLRIGATAISDAATACGFGETTGVPLPEAAGYIPTMASTLRKHNREMTNGDAVQMSIGQGEVLCTPLQAAQAMAGIGNGEVIPNARLVSQLQDYNENIVKQFPITDRGPFPFDQDYRKTVLKGMVAVVSGSGGTGKQAGISAAQVAGKTGTGQWNVQKRQYLAWFTGVVPADKPLYAFAAIYEGVPGEGISGGREAAPIISYAFSRIFKEMSLEELEAESGETGRTAKKVELGAASGEDKPKRNTSSGARRPSAPAARRAEPAPVPAAPAPAAQPERRGGVKGFFRRMMGR